MERKKTLKLTLSKKPFELMVSSQKFYELRKPSKWIKSRLYNKDGTKKHYYYVKFTNGYGNDKPYFVCHFLCFNKVQKDFKKTYPNGLVVEAKEGDIFIMLGGIVEQGNIKKQ